jgi:hypothetical protein
MILSATLVALHGDHEKTTSGVGAPSDAGSTLTASQDRAAQSDLRNALVAAKTMYVDASDYLGADASASGLVLVEPSLCYVDSITASLASDGSCTPISVYGWATGWAAARMSSSGTCFWVKDDAAIGTSYGSGLPCTGVAAAQANASAWS